MAGWRPHEANRLALTILTETQRLCPKHPSHDPTWGGTRAPGSFRRRKQWDLARVVQKPLDSVPEVQFTELRQVVTLTFLLIPRFPSPWKLLILLSTSSPISPLVLYITVVCSRTQRVCILHTTRDYRTSS